LSHDVEDSGCFSTLCH